MDITAYLLDQLRRSSLLEYGACAREFFGADSRHNRKRIRQALCVMRKKRLIKHVFHRTWEIRD